MKIECSTDEDLSPSTTPSPADFVERGGSSSTTTTVTLDDPITTTPAPADGEDRDTSAGSRVVAMVPGGVGFGGVDVVAAILATTTAGMVAVITKNM